MVLAAMRIQKASIQGHQPVGSGVQSRSAFVTAFGSGVHVEWQQSAGCSGIHHTVGKRKDALCIYVSLLVSIDDEVGRFRVVGAQARSNKTIFDTNLNMRPLLTYRNSRIFEHSEMCQILRDSL